MQQGGGEYLVELFVFVLELFLLLLFSFCLLLLAFIHKLLRKDAKLIFKLTTLSFSYWSACLFGILTFIESSACPQVTPVNPQGVCGWFPISLQKNTPLCPALGCSLCPIHTGLWVTTHRVRRGIPQLQNWAVQTAWRPTGHNPQNSHLQQNKTTTLLYSFWVLWASLCSCLSQHLLQILSKPEV